MFPKTLSSWKLLNRGYIRNHVVKSARYSSTLQKTLYTPSHGYVKTTNDSNIQFGLTPKAFEISGAIAYCELLKEGSCVKVGDHLLRFEASKAVSEYTSPLSGRVTRLNPFLARHDYEGFNNAQPEDQWIYEITLDNPSELDSSTTCFLTLDSYKKLLLDEK